VRPPKISNTLNNFQGQSGSFIVQDIPVSNAVNNFDRTNPTTAQVSDLLVMRVTVTSSKFLILLKLVVGMCPWCASHWEDFFSVLSYHRPNTEYADDAFRRMFVREGAL
jgi:hypothetical protein